MPRLKTLALAASLALAGCGGLDVGGPGDSDKVRFAEGYAFVRDRDVHVADVSDLQSAKRLTETGTNSDPFISRDGRLVVYVSTDASGRTSLRRVSTGGTGDSEVLPASDTRQLSQPAVSADGSTIVFIARQGANYRLGLVNDDGSNERAVPQSFYDASPSLYPNGDLLVLSGSDGLSHSELVRVEPSAGVRSSRLAGLPDLGSRAVVSPDGRKIAFEMKRGGLTRIFVVDEAGGTPRQLSATGGDDVSPTWITNDRIGFASDVGGTSIVYENDVSTGTEDSFQATQLGDADQCSYGGGI